MTILHRDTDPRNCGALTIVVGNSTVYANDLLIAVDGDINTHGHGELIASGTTVFIHGILVIIDDDIAQIDDAFHVGAADAANGGSPDVEAY